MSLIETINSRKAELAEVMNRKAYLENEIADLEYRMNSEKINNLKSCLIVTQLIDVGTCVGCQIEDKCTFEGKYKPPKIRRG